jgi:hypothetical protein
MPCCCIQLSSSSVVEKHACFLSHYPLPAVAQFLIAQSLPRNGSTHYIAPAFGLFILNCLQAYQHSFFQGLCFWCLWSASPSFPVAQFSQRLLSNCSLLKATCPKQFSGSARGSSNVQFFLFFCEARVAEAPMSLAIMLFTALLSLGRCAACPECLDTFHNPMEILTSHFRTSSLTVCLMVLMNAL